MRPTRARLWRLAMACVVTAMARSIPLQAADTPGRTLRDGFETPKPAWKQEQTDANLILEAHERSDRSAHEGKLSERFVFNAQVGSAFYYSYALTNVKVTADLKVGLYVKSNHAGAQLLARVILPADTDAQTGRPSFLLVPGAVYGEPDRWQRLDLPDLTNALERQARVLRASSKRPVKLEGAYIEQLVINLFGGPGRTEIFLDELTVGPITRPSTEPIAEGGRKPGQTPIAIEPPATTRPSALVRLDNNRVKKRAADGQYHDWVPTAIHAPGAEIAGLREAGFDVLIDDLNGDPGRAEEAVKRGLLLMPIIGRDADGKFPNAETAAKAIESYPFRNHAAFWDFGDRLGRGSTLKARAEELATVRELSSKIRELPEGISTLTTGLVDDDFKLYARAGRTLSLMGVRPPAWGSSVSPLATYSLLKQRRDLTALVNGGALYWALLPATAPASVALSIWGHDIPPVGGYPVVQPEQLRLETYAALSAGYRGIAYEGDAELTKPDGPGRMLWLEMAILNAEIDVCESILANGSDPIATYNGFNPDPSMLPPPGAQVGMKMPFIPELPPIPGIKAAAISTRDRKGSLVLVTDYAVDNINYKISEYAQFQPPQMAREKVMLTVIVPEGALAYEISPGRFKPIEVSNRYIGGRRLTLEEFDTTALILVTTDRAMAERVEAVINAIRPRAAQLAIEQAELKFVWVSEVVRQLALQGHDVVTDKVRTKREANGGPQSTDQSDLLKRAADNIKAARENLEREDYSNAWSEARRASRALRILMRGHWDNAREKMVQANTDPDDLANENAILLGKRKAKTPLQIVPPVASAPLVAFNTLPQHYVWVDTMKNGRFGRNLVPSGSFEEPESLENEGWVNLSYQYEGIKSSIMPVGDPKYPHGRWLRLRSEAIDPEKIDNLQPFLDFPAVAIRSPNVKVKAGEFFRISVDIERRFKSAPGAGGIIVRDSIGGEALQFSSTEPWAPFHRVVLFRRAPEDGELSVTLGLAGYGGVFFDEFKIQRAESAGASEPRDMVQASPAPLPPAMDPTARRETRSDRPSR